MAAGGAHCGHRNLSNQRVRQPASPFGWRRQHGIGTKTGSAVMVSIRESLRRSRVFLEKRISLLKHILKKRAAAPAACNRGNTMRIGLISDTHNLLRPEARIALAGTDRILHAGDICGMEVLDQLARIAPVTAVRGNNDRNGGVADLPERVTVECGGVKIHVVHDLHDLDIAPEEHGIGVVVSGHSHRPLSRREGGVLYVNPGSAGPRRFKLPASLGFLEIEGSAVKAILQVLEVN
jgi:putative phosphoesterase